MITLKKMIPKPLKVGIKEKIVHFNSLGKQKIFCIGLNKTGTTSLKIAMQELGFPIGNQRKAEEFIFDWGNRDFRKLIRYCNTAQFFQDSPFSFPFTFIVLDQAFPNSKFILTIRDDPDQWYNSITKFHAKIWGKDGRIPTKEDLMEATYQEKGRPWISNRMKFDTPEDDPYKKDVLIKYYNNHNQNVIDYFKHKDEQLLILNVSDEDAYNKLCNFVGKEPMGKTFPWKNKTSEVKP